jgi:F0F1-type ATP synthase delta subunit
MVQNLVKPDILGGLILQVENLWINASLKGHLEKLRKELLAASPISRTL